MPITEKNKINFKIRLNSAKAAEIYQKWREFYQIHDKPNHRSMNSVLEQLIIEGMLNYMTDNYVEAEIISKLRQELERSSNKMSKSLKSSFAHSQTETKKMTTLTNLKQNLIVQGMINKGILTETEAEFPDLENLKNGLIWEKDVMKDIERREQNILTNQRKSSTEEKSDNND